METKAHIPFWLVPAAFLFLSGCQVVGVPQPDQLSAEVELVCRNQAAAWNRGDLEGFMSEGYMRSEELTFYSGGSISHGYDAMLEHYRKSYQAAGREMGQLAFTDFDPLPLDNEHAVMRGRWRLHFEKQEDVGGLFTLVFVHTGVGWRIVHDHTSLEAPKSKSAGSSSAGG
jgi:beta-aspartyl-peptidase (threonine type)